MRIKSGKLLPFLAITVALLIFLFSQTFSESTTAQVSFIGSLPTGYTAYSGKLAIGKSCSCSTGGISGAPAGPPPCETVPCFGSSSTRYGWFSTNVAGIRGIACDELRKTIKSLPSCFQLDGDDALVISGSMSPIQNLPYYSFTLYQSLTYKDTTESKYYPIQSSVNLGINNTTLKQGTNGKYVLIVAANTQTINVVKKALRATGVPDAIMNSYLVPASVANVGSFSYPDQLSLAFRLSFQSEAERQQANTFAQQTAPATSVVFVKGPGIKGNISFNNLPKWEDTLKVNESEYTTGLDKNLNALEAAVSYSYAKKGYKLKARIREKLLHVDANACRTNKQSCVYDSPDALYSSFPCDFSPSLLRNGNCQIELGPNNQDVLMWVGVDHSLVGNKLQAAYWSGESQSFQGGNDGTFSFVGLYTQGSAKQYLRSNKVNNLYAIKIARTCGNELYCGTVPVIGTTPNKTGFIVVGRTYLDKTTGSGPNPANLVPASLLWFTKN